MSEIFAIIRFGDVSEYRAAIESADIDILDENGSNLLAPAIAYDRLDIAKDLIARGIDINHSGERGMTPLQLAIQWKRSELAKELVNLGSELNSRDVYGNNSLWYAAVDPQKDYELIKLLVEKGSDHQTKNNAGRSPLDFAQQINDEKLIEIFSHR